MHLPFSRFSGQLRQLHVDDLTEFFDIFFPRFRTEQDENSFVTRGTGRLFFEDVVLGPDSAVFAGGGRARRFAGSHSLPRKRYYCLVDSQENTPENNTLLGELFAYCDPRLPVEASLLDSTVDVDKVDQLLSNLSWSHATPSIYHLFERRQLAWLYSPVIGISKAGGVARYPLSFVDVDISKTIDLRLPSTLDWAFRTFVELEMQNQGSFRDSNGRILNPIKLDPPSDVNDFVPLLLSQTLGGGSTFIQGIGAFLRAHGADALIYPSARSDSRAVVRDGVVLDSFGYILVDYRDAPGIEFESTRYFGGLPAWREKLTRPFEVERVTDGRSEILEIKGVRRLQEARFAVFSTWTRDTFFHTISGLQDRSLTLSSQIPVQLRRPSEVVGTDATRFLGTDQEFRLAEGGPATGFLVDWRFGTVGTFLCSALPAAQSPYWVPKWDWDEENGFLYRICLRRPWVLTKCPACLEEQFWMVNKGKLRGECSCGFSMVPNESSLSRYTEWANHLEDHSDLSDMELYSAVCNRNRDAITGVLPPIHPSSFDVISSISDGFEPGENWFLSRRAQQFEAVCPNCGWRTAPTLREEYQIGSACPSCAYSADAPNPGDGESDTLEKLPADFVDSVTTTIVSLMNQPSFRNAIEEVQPDDPNAMVAYLALLRTAVPTLPELTLEQFWEITYALKAMLRDEDEEPIDVPADETFMFVSQFLSFGAKRQDLDDRGWMDESGGIRDEAASVLAEAVFGLFNRPSFRAAIRQIDPQSDDAHESYVGSIRSSLPAFPQLSSDHFYRVVVEVFQFLPPLGEAPVTIPLSNAMRFIGALKDEGVF